MEEIKRSFEEFKSMVLDVLEDEKRESYA